MWTDRQRISNIVQNLIISASVSEHSNQRPSEINLLLTIVIRSTVLLGKWTMPRGRYKSCTCELLLLYSIWQIQLTFPSFRGKRISRQRLLKSTHREKNKKQSTATDGTTVLRGKNAQLKFCRHPY